MRHAHPRRARRGMASVEMVLNFATFYTIAALSIRFAFKLCAMLHHTIATLVGWPIL